MLKNKKEVIDIERISNDYFKEISKFKALSKDEELSLWEKYKKENDLSARDKLVKSNLKFVAKVAKPYIGMGLSYPDLIAEGNLGLMKAIDKFDYKRGLKTISYSVWWIKQTILEALNERNGFKHDELPQDFEKPVDFDAEDDYNIKAVSDNYKERDDMNPMDDWEMKKIVKNLLGCLTDRERKIIEYYYGIGDHDEMTLEDIGRALNLTKERVRQIKERAMKKLRSEVLEKSIPFDIYK